MNLSGHLIWEHLDIFPFFFFCAVFYCYFSFKYLHSSRKAVFSATRLWAEKVPCWQTLMGQLSGRNWMSLMCPERITSVFWYPKKNKYIQTYSHSELNKVKLWLKYNLKKNKKDAWGFQTIINPKLCMTSTCQTPHSTLQPVKAITASWAVVPKWHVICWSAWSVLF